MNTEGQQKNLKAKAQAAFTHLRDYCEKQNYRGWDPFDGLNSRIFNSTFINRSRLARLIWVQLFKRSPLNLRKIAIVNKGVNAQGLALFLSGYANIIHYDQTGEVERNIKKVIEELLNLKSRGFSGSCWGYNFAWQARAFYQPINSPTIVATSFVGNGLLDAYEVIKDEVFLDQARSACDFILNDLNKFYDKDGDFGFSYSPIDKTPVYNASFLGARLLARVYSLTGEKELYNSALSAVSYCIKGQDKDGSWSYGEKAYHSWKDNFHTGYNLECLFDVIRYCNADHFTSNFQRGMEYYLNNFFLDNGFPKYYSNKIYPADINSSAQLIVTLGRTGQLNNHLELADKVLDWTLKNLYNGQYFYYQQKKFYTIKIPYMRWSQAWMFYALSCYLREINE